MQGPKSGDYAMKTHDWIIVALLAARNSVRHPDAADAMLESEWATQTPARAQKYAQIMRTGVV